MSNQAGPSDGVSPTRDGNKSRRISGTFEVDATSVGSETDGPPRDTVPDETQPAEPLPIKAGSEPDEIPRNNVSDEAQPTEPIPVGPVDATRRLRARGRELCERYEIGQETGNRISYGRIATESGLGKTQARRAILFSSLCDRKPEVLELPNLTIALIDLVIGLPPKQQDRLIRDWQRKPEGRHQIERQVRDSRPASVSGRPASTSLQRALKAALRKAEQAQELVESMAQSAQAKTRAVLGNVIPQLRDVCEPPESTRERQRRRRR